ncbi:MAG: hypothetical protein NVSMB42_20570 [Herpetosiphon sp.]
MRADFLHHIACLEQEIGGNGSDRFRESVRLNPYGRYAHEAWRGAMNHKP